MLSEQELLDYRMFFLELTDIWRDYIPDKDIRKHVDEKAMRLLEGYYTMRNALQDIVDIPPCTCGDRKHGMSCMCGNYNADEIARKALELL